MAKAKRRSARVVKQPVKEQRSRFPNLLLGTTFVIIMILLLSLFFRTSTSQFSLKNLSKIFTRSNSAITQQATPAPAPENGQKSSYYVVKQGDTLWQIAEAKYGSGFNYTDIVQANKLKNPGSIEVGERLILPKTEAKTPTQGEVAGTAAITTTPYPNTPNQQINKSEYIVQRGDNLWNIAVQRYGNGFMWTKIAQVNNLSNPRVIHVGNRLILPS